MKKLIAILLAVFTLFGIAACGSDNNASTPAVTAQGDAQQILDDFYAKAKTDSDALTLASDLAAAEYLPFDCDAESVEPGWLMGFSADEMTGFEEGARFSPIIGTIPFLGYVFTLEDNADVDTFMQLLKDQANPRWNICTKAEEVVVANVGNTVLLVMSPLSFE